MLVSLKEVKKYVDLEGISTEEIASRLTFSGIEVEGIKEVASATNLVIGEVVECENHPDSDHLHVCKVNVGDEVLDIVCGAPNCRKGLKVIVARAGAILNHDKEIKKGEIRGQVSNGMLCALNELGVDPKTLRKEQIEGIEELPSDAIVGNTKVLEYLGLDDEILDLSLLANRSDCYSLFNVARELGALFNRKVTIPEAKEEVNYVESNLKLEVNSENTKSFFIKVVKGVSVKESPSWLKNVLRSENINSVNNIVDLGNYIMLLTGQPIHAYDLDKVNNELKVNQDFEGKFVALDNSEHEVKKGDIVIESNSKVMSLGGIIGANDSKIDENTKNIAIEVANFDFATVRKTAIRMGISTDSSQRFIKGINKDQSEYVLNLFVKILKELSEFKEVSQIIKVDKLNHDKKIISCSKDYINNRLGSNFTLLDITNCLKLLNFEIEILDDNNFNATVPTFRIDVEGKADLSEEIIRYYGFDTITTSLPVMETTVGKLSSTREKERVIEDYLLSKGLYEVLTYTLINKKDNDMLNIINTNEGIEIFNPLTEDHKYIRRNLLSSILRCAEYNINHNNDNPSLFEISNVYSKGNKEEIHLSIALIGNKFEKDLLNSKPKDFFDLKGYVESILTLFNVDSNRVKYERFESNEFHPGRSALIKIDNKVVGVIGDIHPLLRDEFSFKKESVVIGEINLSLLFSIKTGKNKFMEYSKFPSITRDLAFTISNEYKYIDVKKEIKKVSGLIKKVEVFDIYNGEHVKSNHTSIALRLTLESMDETLKEDTINLVINKVKETLINKFKVEFRG